MPRPNLTRFGPYAALALLGFSIVLAVSTAHPGPRHSRRERLVDLIEIEDGRARELRAQLDTLQRQLDGFERSSGAGKKQLASLRAQVDELRAMAGQTAIEGPGVVVELRDSRLRRSPTGDPNDLVIHEQDLQAVVNALWSAGAEAIAINGERLTATSAVRCVGNTLLLHGSVYAPPYRIAAIGQSARLAAGLRRDPLVERFAIFAEEFRLGFDVRSAQVLRLAGFNGVLSADSARIET